MCACMRASVSDKTQSPAPTMFSCRFGSTASHFEVVVSRCVLVYVCASVHVCVHASVLPGWAIIHVQAGSYGCLHQSASPAS